MSEEQTQSTSTADSSEPAAPDFMGAIRELGASKGIAFPGDPAPAEPGKDEQAPDEAAAAEPVEGEPAEPTEDKAAADKKAAPDPKSLMDKVARKDADLQRERAARRELEQRMQRLEQEREEEARAWREDPLGALHRKGLTQAQLNERYLNLDPKDEAKPKADTSNLPPEVQQALKRLEALEQKSQASEQELQQARLEQHKTQQVDMLKDHLSKFDEYELLNDMGAHGAVYESVLQHLAGGRFEDDEHAASVISVLAQREENRLREELRGHLGKPKVRAFLERELRGVKSESRPARREPQGAPLPSNPVRSQLSSDLQQERTLRPPPSESWNPDDAWRRTLQEAEQIPL